MQAVKEKFHDTSVKRQVKAEAKAEEKEAKEVAKAQMDVAHELRLAKEAEAEMKLHARKADEKTQEELAKHPDHQS